MKKLLFVIFLFFLLSPIIKAQQWTIMVYLDGDNDLEPFANADFLEMAAIGSTSEVNIVVQIDRTTENTMRYYIEKGLTLDSEPIEDCGELNMGAPETLQDFIEWAISNYPADKYMLVLWNHGDGWRKRVKKTAKQVCYDENEDDWLTMDEVKEAISNAISNTIGDDGKLDIIAFDACLMGMVEVATEIKSLANVMVASEQTEPGDGWPYHYILKELVRRPTLSAKGLARLIVQKYYEYYILQAGELDITYSAIDLTKIDELNTKIKNFVESTTNTNRWQFIQRAREAAKSYENSDYIDIYHLMSKIISSGMPDRDVVNAANEVRRGVRNAVILSKCGPSATNSNGLSIFFPISEDNFIDSDVYISREFDDTTQWSTFLYTYFNPPSENGVDGSGSAKIEGLSSFKAGCKVKEIKIVFTATQDLSNGQLTLDIPESWTMPRTTNLAPGQVVVTKYTGANISWSLNNRTITINLINFDVGKKLGISYRNAIAPSMSDNYKFTIKTKGSGGTLTEIAESPIIRVY
ncbi:MAG TPA: clostripain-related cysteine peptidase [bacterium]|mgnify:FL=1|nr:clostripain-related cysteine peptidase [bacterium]